MHGGSDSPFATAERDLWSPPAGLVIAAIATLVRFQTIDRWRTTPTSLFGIESPAPPLWPQAAVIAFALGLAGVLAWLTAGRAPRGRARAWSDGHGWLRAAIAGALLSQVLVAAAATIASGVMPFGQGFLFDLLAAGFGCFFLAVGTRVVIDPDAGTLVATDGHPIPFARCERKLSELEGVAIEKYRRRRGGPSWHVVAWGVAPGSRTKLFVSGSEELARRVAADIARFAGLKAPEA